MRARVRPSKASSLMSVVMLSVFSLFGFWALAEGQWFGLIWLLFIFIGLVFSIANLSSKKGVSVEDIEIENPEFSAQGNSSKNDFEEKLRNLESLKKDNLITEEEYKKKRSQIMKQDW